MRWILLVTAWLAAPVAHATVVFDEITSVSATIPAGGVIVIAGSCSSFAPTCKWRLAPRVEREDGTPVSGRIEAMGQLTEESTWIAFLLDPPVPAGARLRVFDEVSAKTFEVRVSEAPAFDPASVSVELTTERERLVRRRCCDERFEQTGGPTCVDFAEDVYRTLEGAVVQDQVASSQYFFELAVFPQGQSAGEPVWQLSPHEIHWFEPPAAETYCYLVRAKPIRGGELFTVREGCVPNTVHDVGRRELLTPEQVKDHLAGCALPTDLVADASSSFVRDAAQTEVAQPPVRADAAHATAARRQEEGCALASDARASVWAILLACLLRRRAPR